MKLNQVYTQSIPAFGPQVAVSKNANAAAAVRPCDMIPCGAQLNENGDAVFSMYAPQAEKVSVIIMPQTEYTLEKQADGLWQTVLHNPPKGFLTLQFVVDGTNVLNETAPVGFGSLHPINFLDVPGDGTGFFEIEQVPHGSVRHELYYSETTKRYETCVIYTPPGYDNSSEKYPVLYLQHGHGENENCWVWQGKVNLIMDNLLAEGKALPCIIVMNNGMTMVPGENGEYHFDYYAIEKLLLHDCIPFVEKHFRVKPGKENRAMAGLSMGSMQTSYITLSHPDLFFYVGVFSGFLRNLLDPNASMSYFKTLDDKDHFEESFRVFFRAIGRSDQFHDRFDADDLLMESKGLVSGKCKNIVRREYDGAHEWKVWRECARDFLPLLWRE